MSIVLLIRARTAKLRKSKVCSRKPYMPTLSELKAEQARIDQLLYSSWLLEREEARKRIAEIAVEFQLSPSIVARDVESAQRSAPPAPAVLRPPKVELPLRKEGLAQHVAAKYRRQTTGDTWSGRGPRPKWLRDALEAGSALEEFLVREDEPSAADPLREFQDAAKRSRLARRG